MSLPAPQIEKAPSSQSLPETSNDKSISTPIIPQADDSSAPAVDLEQASQFLQALGNPTEFRTFSDKDKEDVRLRKKYSGPFDDVAEQLVEANVKGAGVFVVINEGGQTDAEISDIRAVFADFDGTPAPTLGSLHALGVEPSIVVQSSTPDRLHYYWRVTGEFAVDDFKPLQQAIIKRLGSDPAICNPSRVMRLPGFLHQKKISSDPIITRLVHVCDKSYTLEELRAAFQVNVESTDQSPSACKAPSHNQIQKMFSALYALPQNYLINRQLWFIIACALHNHFDGSDEGFQIFDEWSQGGGDAYGGTRQLWDSLKQKRNRITISSLYFHARNNGWVWSGTTGKQDSILAAQIADELRDYVLFDITAQNWYLLRAGLWCRKNEIIVKKLIATLLTEILPDGYSNGKLNAITALVQLELKMAEWTKDRNLIPLKNGVLDTTTNQLSDYDGQYRFNWQLPYPYGPDAQCTVIQSWLTEVTGGDLTAIAAIRAFMKIALISGDIQKFLELVGPGGTAKSTLVRLITALVGGNNTMTTDLKNLEGNRFELAGLYGKRLVVINDSSRYGGEVAVLKALTGGDRLRFEEKNKQQCDTFVFDGVVIVTSNEPIQTSDYTSGLIRRRLPIMFTRRITDADKAKWQAVGGIEVAMHQELPGLLNWVLEMPDSEVRAAIGGINGGMTPTERSHLIETNKLAAWIDEQCVVDADGAAHIGADINLVTHLYSNYCFWCKSGNVNPMALQRFSANLIDVCDQVGLKVSKMKRSSKGARVQGLVVRTKEHGDKPTPITGQMLEIIESSRPEVVLRYPIPE